MQRSCFPPIKPLELEINRFIWAPSMLPAHRCPRSSDHSERPTNEKNKQKETWTQLDGTKTTSMDAKSHQIPDSLSSRALLQSVGGPAPVRVRTLGRSLAGPSPGIPDQSDPMHRKQRETSPPKVSPLVLVWSNESNANAR